MSYLSSFCLVFLYLFFSPLFIYADGKPVINEFLSHPSTGNHEWVELYVPDGVDVANYWIDDDGNFANDAGSSSKKQITSVVQGSDSHHVVYELSSSMFNNDGDTIALFTPDGELVDQYEYTSDPGIDNAIGRTPDTTGGFQILASATRGSANSTPRPPDTATPAPTSKPTPTDKPPKPTETPKPIKATPFPTPPHTDKVSSATSLVTQVKKDFSPTITTSSNSAYPTAVLSASTKAADKKFIPSVRKSVVVKASTNTIPRIVAVSIGGLLLLGCGILLYFKKKGISFWERKGDE